MFFPTLIVVVSRPFANLVVNVLRRLNMRSALATAALYESFGSVIVNAAATGLRLGVCVPKVGLLGGGGGQELDMF